MSRTTFGAGAAVRWSLAAVLAACGGSSDLGLFGSGAAGGGGVSCPDGRCGSAGGSIDAAVDRGEIASGGAGGTGNASAGGAGGNSGVSAGGSGGGGAGASVGGGAGEGGSIEAGPERD